MENLAIQIKNVSFSYTPERKVLHGVTLEVARGQIAGVLGPNGGGKTTLFKIISSLIRNFDGEVRINNLTQKNDLQRYLEQIGVVFQSPSLDKKLTVEENLTYQGALYGISNKILQSRMNMLLEKLSLTDRKKDLVGELSGGLARRVEIVKSLLHSPKILIMDEPSTGLDIGVRIDLWKLLTDIRSSEDVTILLTTHFIEEADRCDTITLIDHGKMICEGSPETLKQKLTFRQFSVRPRNIAETQKQLREQFEISSQEKNGYLTFQADPTNAQRISSDLASSVLELTYRDPSLEDVFLAHTGRTMNGSL